VTFRVVPSWEVLSAVHLLDGEVFDWPRCPVLWYPPLDDEQWIAAWASVGRRPVPVDPRGDSPEAWSYWRRYPDGLCPERPRATYCGRAVTNDPPWLEWPEDDPLPVCLRCAGEVGHEEATLL